MYKFISVRGQTLAQNVRKNITQHTSSRAKKHRENVVIELGYMDASDEFGRSFQAATESSRHKKKLKKILQKDTDIEYPNSLGQTPLFCAAAQNNFDGAILLLKSGANPNMPDVNGRTPLHVACFKGNIRLVCRMIDSGGDLSMHDNNGYGVLEWASRNANPKLQQQMTQLLEKLQPFRDLRLCQMCHSRHVAGPTSVSHLPERSDSQTSVMEMLDHKINSATSLISLKSDESAGFGQVYPSSKKSAGIVSMVPLISERMLRNMTNVTYECSLDFTMREMMWAQTPVIVKQLKSEFEVHERAILIMNEAEKFGKLRHPNILLFMALCQPKTLDMMTLVFENADKQNLYQVLHRQSFPLNYDNKFKISCQLCFVLEFICNQDLIHSGLSSKAVYLTSNFDVKLGNFEFMMESSSDADQGKLSIVSTYPRATHLYPWMAPEVMMGSPPSFSSDIFSYCCIVWELFRAIVPWSWLTVEEHYKCVEKGKNIGLSIIFLPRALHFLHESMNLNKDERQGDISILSFMLKSLELQGQQVNKLSFGYDNKSNSARTLPKSANLEKGQTPKQDNFLSDSSDENPQDVQDDQHREGASSSVPTDDSHLKQPVKPASHANMSFPYMRSERKDRSNVRMKSMSKTDISDRESSLSEEPSVSVKEMASIYQQCVNQHKLRQAILKGSTNPHGSCPELDSQSSSSKRNSLPANLGGEFSLNTESSKSWTTDNDDSERIVSEIGDLSSTPKLRNCSTPERSIHLKDGLDKHVFCPTRVAYARNCLLQHRLRDVGIGCTCKGGFQEKTQDKEQVILVDRVNIDNERDPKKFQCALDEVKLVKSAQSSTTSFDVKNRGKQTQTNAPDLNHFHASNTGKLCHMCKTAPREDTNMTNHFLRNSLELKGAETQTSDLSWDLTQVTPLEETNFADLFEGCCQENALSKSLMSCTINCKDQQSDSKHKKNFEVDRQNPDMNLNHLMAVGYKEAVATDLNGTFTVGDENAVVNKTFHADVDPISFWVDAKLEDIKKREMNQGWPKTERKANSSLVLSEEITKHKENECLMSKVDRPLNMIDDDLIGSYQEFYIDDDLNNEMKDHLKCPEGDGCINNHMSKDDQSKKSSTSIDKDEQLKPTMPSGSRVLPRHESGKELSLDLPPPAIIKPKRRTLKLKDHFSQPGFATQLESIPSHYFVSENEESLNTINPSSKEKHGTMLKAWEDLPHKLSQESLDLEEKEEQYLMDHERHLSLTSGLMPVLKNRDDIEKAPVSNGETGKSDNFDNQNEDHVYDYYEHPNHPIELASLADAAVLKPNKVPGAEHFPPKPSPRHSVLDQATQMEESHVMVKDVKNQEVQVANDCDSLDSNEWVTEKLRILRDKIKRRKHRLVYCISSDEDDTEDKEGRQRETGFYSHTSKPSEDGQSMDFESHPIDFKMRDQHGTIEESNFERFQQLSPCSSMQFYTSGHTSHMQAKSDSCIRRDRHSTFHHDQEQDLMFLKSYSDDSQRSHETEKQKPCNMWQMFSDENGSLDLNLNDEQKSSEFTKSKHSSEIFVSGDFDERPSHNADENHVSCSQTKSHDNVSAPPMYYCGAQKRFPEEETTLSQSICSPTLDQKYASGSSLKSMPHKKQSLESIDTLQNQSSLSQNMCSPNLGQKYPSGYSLKSVLRKKQSQESIDAFQSITKAHTLSESSLNARKSLKRGGKSRSVLVPRSSEHSVTFSDVRVCNVNSKEKYDCRSFQGENSSMDVDEEADSLKGYSGHPDEHCLILNLGNHDASSECTGKASSTSDRLSKSGKIKSWTGFHKFFLPSIGWSNGCRAKLHVKLSPTNPRKHHVTTTATDPQSGHTEILLEETIVTNKLQSSFNFQ